ncbi:MAG: ArsA family ATPase [Geodermatophilaceae bacterium]|nr:ArsA family ATPase [Geodermatophilaceae bacterium]
MRLVLFTGKGGVGKTTVAAATAATVAARGHKVLLVSTDTAHSLGDVLGTPLHDAPAEVDTGLAAMQIDPQARFERAWADARRYLVELLGRGGLAAVAAEELMVLPGVAELLALDSVQEQAAGGRYDAVVVDCAPSAETLRLLGLPRVLEWYLERAAPAHRRVVRGLGPLLGGLPMPGDAVVAAVSRLHGSLLGVQELLAAPGTTVRLVLTPESLVLAEARRTATALALFGHRLDAVVVNRMIPGGQDPWRAAQAGAQAARLADVEASFPGVPIHTAAYRPGEPLGVPALGELGHELYGAADPLAAAAPEAPQVRRVADDHYELALPLPHVDREAVDLARSGDELVLTVAGHRRLLALPGVLRRCRVERAELTDGRLVMTFRPDPALWPGRR